MKTQANLDALRSLAVGMVLVSHYASGTSSFHLQAVGLLGVAVFFVHTCLVLMQSLACHGPAWLPFLIRRAFRIYPLAIATTLVSAAAVYTHRDWQTIACNSLLIQNLCGAESIPPPLWSLPYEMQMYCVLPALFAWTALGKGTAKIAILWFAAVAAIVALAAASMPYDLLKYVPCFLPGVLAYHLRRSGVRPSIAPSWMIGYVCVSALTMGWAVPRGLPETPFLWAFCLGLGALIPFVKPMEHPLPIRATHWIATISFGIYLFHQPVLDVMLRLAPAAGAPLALVVTVLLSWGTYHLLERPCIGWGARVSDRWRKPVLHPQPAALPSDNR